MLLLVLLCARLCAAALSGRVEFRLAGLFQIHGLRPGRPLARGCCVAAAFKSHGYHLAQTMRFAVEEINNSSALLPNVTLRCEIHDTCTEAANLHATLRALGREGRHRIELQSALQRYEPRAVAVIGPDSTQLALTAAAVLGVFLVPEISYEASLETLSLKRFYPSFLRTIPSDGQQVKAIALLLQHFGWTWVALVGSDNSYGRDGLNALYELLATSDVCVAYRGIIPATKDASSPEIHKLIQILVDIRVNVTVVFSNRRNAQPFFEAVVQKNITGMVWVGSEDWSLAQTIWQVPSIRNIGSVIGISVEQAEPTMLKRLESWENAKERGVSGSAGSTGLVGENGLSSSEGVQLNCTQHCPGGHLLADTPDVYDIQASYNVYSAVYAVAHGLHDLLGCTSGVCSKGRVYPWQLLQKIKQVNFSLHKSQISFDANGNIRKGYNIIAWNWRGQSWAFDVVGAFTVNPDQLHIDQSKILWHTKDHQQAPVSLCSWPCAAGEMRLQQNRHRCCFSCVACPAGTFLNRTAPYACQACGRDEWAPVGSESCFNRTVEFLSWADPLCWVLLIPTVLLLVLTAGLAALFARNVSTPVVRSAGGKMCFLMLGALACACSSIFFNFGEPTWLSCLVHFPLLTVSFTVFLSCVATRCFQIVCIFKLSARWRALQEAWQRRGGPALFIAASTTAQAALCAAAAASGPAVPRRRYSVAAERVVLECGAGSAPCETAAMLYNVLLSLGCFALSYAGKDLPADYNEAKCLTCSLLLHLVCSAAVLCTRSAFRGRSAAVTAALGALGTLAALLGGYFLPKGFVVLLRPHLNTAEHFQRAIRSYTRRRDD
ncbi:taste receptor type 1 member 1 isoform X1 [Tympanuchus pallidicinctus]|uniref:taste receptor type 1 member 1 isoform X1 n=1 Tax=Tympanuchus pallidicinctus TaxID=109042 RepID=UPI0022874627|nr:taste receptor type 1 member 1 isoform X1 [Tympanuchus pallidicinctus]